MSLQDWLNSGWLTKHEPTATEISNLLALAERDLKDCRARDISPDWRFNIAYNAALQASTAALAAAGFRASREAHHYRIIMSLEYTIGAEREMVIQLDMFRKKRNVSEYERANIVSATEAKEMMSLAKTLLQNVRLWIKEKHPHLMV
jgi:hypothetical protein